MNNSDLEISFAEAAPPLSSQLAGFISPEAGLMLDIHRAAIHDLELSNLLTKQEASRAYDRLASRAQTAVNRFAKSFQ